MPARSFPPGFLWGTATSAHQVEGGNWNSDWWAWEHTAGSPCQEPSGDACDHWHRYPEDVRLLAQLGFTAYRFSLEWARIEPEDGEFSLAALDHYRRMCATCLEHGLEAIVTLHHFTLPRWLAARGGFTDAATSERFVRYAARAARHLRGVVGRICTINEPNIVAAFGHQWGLFPPGLRDPEARHRADATLIAAHCGAVPAVKAALPGTPVGLCLSMTDYQAEPGGEALRDAERALMEDQYLEAARGDDFIGVQTYTRMRFGPEGPLPPPQGARLTMMPYEYWPQGLEATIRRAAALTQGIPILVTEHGIATADDTERIAFVGEGLRGLQRCLADGIDVRGYVYWSLLDNFEWIFGYQPTFGLVAVDRTTQRRIPKPSATWLGAVARANALEE